MKREKGRLEKIEKFYFIETKFGGKDYNTEELSMEKLRQTMSDQEWLKIYEMSQDKNLMSHLCQSLFPMIYGKKKVQRVFKHSFARFSTN